MKTEDIDKKIGMPDVDAEWARFEREVIGSADVSSATGSADVPSATGSADVSSANGNTSIPAPRSRTIYAWIGGLAIAASILLLFMLNMGTDVAKEAPLVAQQVSSPEKDEQPLPSPEKDAQPLPSTDTDAQPLPSPEKDAQPLPSHQGEGLGVGSVTKPASDINPGPPHASSPAVSPSENQSSEKDTEPEIKVFASVEQSASFPGGDRACLTFIEENMRVPELATTYGVKARVIITFLVGKTGELSNIKVIRNNMTCDSTLISQLSETEQTQIKEQLTQQLSDEAVRIVSIMPRWRPAKINGETQEQRYILPIRFNQETNH